MTETVAWNPTYNVPAGVEKDAKQILINAGVFKPEYGLSEKERFYSSFDVDNCSLENFNPYNAAFQGADRTIKLAEIYAGMKFSRETGVGRMLKGEYIGDAFKNLKGEISDFIHGYMDPAVAQLNKDLKPEDRKTAREWAEEPDKEWLRNDFKRLDALEEKNLDEIHFMTEAVWKKTSYLRNCGDSYTPEQRIQTAQEIIEEVSGFKTYMEEAFGIGSDKMPHVINMAESTARYEKEKAMKEIGE